MLQQIAHYGIIFILLTGFLSAVYMVYVVLRGDDNHVGPLFSRVKAMPQDLFLRRRLYAIEAWLTFGFLSVYLALTSLRP